MDKARCSNLQTKLKNEALAMLALTGHEKSVTEYQQAIRLVGKACGIPLSDTEEHLKLIDAAKDEVRRKNAGEIISQHTDLWYVNDKKIIGLVAQPDN